MHLAVPLPSSKLHCACYERSFCVDWNIDDARDVSARPAYLSLTISFIVLCLWNSLTRTHTHTRAHIIHTSVHPLLHISLLTLLPFLPTLCVRSRLYQLLKLIPIAMWLWRENKMDCAVCVCMCKWKVFAKHSSRLSFLFLLLLFLVSYEAWLVLSLSCHEAIFLLKKNTIELQT